MGVGQEKNKIIVVGIPTASTAEDLRLLCKPFGSIQEATIVTDADGGCRGFGFVRFETEEAQQEAVAKLNKTSLKGRTLNVRVVEKRSPAGTAAPNKGASGNGRPCFDFARGKCTKGAACKWSHALAAETADEGSAEHRTRRPEWQQKRDLDTRVPSLFDGIPDDVCRKYQLGKCHRGAACRWKHVLVTKGRGAAAVATGAAAAAVAAAAERAGAVQAATDESARPLKKGGKAPSASGVVAEVGSASEAESAWAAVAAAGAAARGTKRKAQAASVGSSHGTAAEARAATSGGASTSLPAATAPAGTAGAVGAAGAAGGASQQPQPQQQPRAKQQRSAASSKAIGGEEEASGAAELASLRRQLQQKEATWRAQHGGGGGGGGSGGGGGADDVPVPAEAKNRDVVWRALERRVQRAEAAMVAVARVAMEG